jgi:TolB-like protein
MSGPAVGEGILKSCEAGQSSGPTLKPESAIPVSAHQIRQQLAKICTAEEFQRSKRSQRFLNYIVEETLAGRAGRIKAYSVAISVLNRDDTFDPQTDPMVRIEASQLRRRLERYYLIQGVDDPVIIDLPKGGYVPVFKAAAGLDLPANTDTPPSHGITSQRISTAVLATTFLAAFLAISVIAVVIFWIPAGKTGTPIFAAEGRPTIQVLPFSAVTTDDRSAAIAAGLADEVTQVLTVHGTLGVLAPPDKIGGVTPNRADMLLTGSVRSNAGVIRLTASLVDARMGTYVWSEAYDMPADDPVLTLQTGLASDLGSHLATSSGVMARLITQAVSKSGILPASLPADR